MAHRDPPSRGRRRHADDRSSLSAPSSSQNTPSTSMSDAVRSSLHGYEPWQVKLLEDVLDIRRKAALREDVMSKSSSVTEFDKLRAEMVDSGSEANDPESGSEAPEELEEIKSDNSEAKQSEEAQMHMSHEVVEEEIEFELESMPSRHSEARQTQMEVQSTERRSPGRRSPGRRSPGMRSPGRRSPGRRSPESQSGGSGGSRERRKASGRSRERRKASGRSRERRKASSQSRERRNAERRDNERRELSAERRALSAERQARTAERKKMIEAWRSTSPRVDPDNAEVPSSVQYGAQGNSQNIFLATPDTRADNGEDDEGGLLERLFERVKYRPPEAPERPAEPRAGVAGQPEQYYGVDTLRDQESGMSQDEDKDSDYEEEECAMFFWIACICVAVCILFAGIGGFITVLIWDDSDEPSRAPTISPAPTFAERPWPQVGEDLRGLEGHNFGQTIALSGDGSSLAIGAGARNPNGIVEVFDFEDSSWTQVSGALASGFVDSAEGHSVSLSLDGTILAAGDPAFGSSSFRNGTVRVWSRQAVAGESNWNLIGSFFGGTYFGWSVVLSGEGNTVAVGAPGAGRVVRSGRVSVWRNMGDSWTPKGNSLTGTEVGDFFGTAIDLSEDGNILAVGANGADGGGINSGIVRVYEYMVDEDTGNDFWDPRGDDLVGTPGDRFGDSVAMSADGSIVAVGAPRHNSRGQVVVFRWNETDWNEIGELEGESENDWFGGSLCLSADGRVLVVGAPAASRGGPMGAFRGQVHVFQYDGKRWQQTLQLTGDSASDNFGLTVATAADGKTFGVSAALSDNAGLVRVFSETLGEPDEG